MVPIAVKTSSIAHHIRNDKLHRSFAFGSNRRNRCFWGCAVRRICSGSGRSSPGYGVGRSAQAWLSRAIHNLSPNLARKLQPSPDVVEASCRSLRGPPSEAVPRPRRKAPSESATGKHLTDDAAVGADDLLAAPGKP